MAAFVAGLLITVSTADAGAGLPPPGDEFNAGDFLCYSGPVAEISVPIRLSDQFGDQGHTVTDFLGICASGNKDTLFGFFNSPFGFLHHMMRWAIDDPSPDVFKVKLTDQFGTFEHNVFEAREIITPASKKLPCCPEFFPKLDVHWKCYRIDGEAIDGPVVWRDQFSNPSAFSFNELTPDLLCAPATKTKEPSPGVILEFPPEEDVHLKCYNVESFSDVPFAGFSDQFSDIFIFGMNSEKLCTTAIKTLPVPCVKFTVKGEDIPDSKQCNPEANDITVVFRGGATMQFTKDGAPVGLPIPKAKGANDFELNFDPVTCDITSGTWTKRGAVIGPLIPIPSGANDFEFVAKKIAKATWTLNGDILEEIPIPKGHVTDIHFECGFLPDLGV